MYMKNIIKTIAFLVAVLLLASCHKITSEGVTQITYYPSITIIGGDLTIELGTDFTDPGYIVMEGENDITSKTIVRGTVNTNKVGLYRLSYSATNVDGFSGSATRKVYVYDPSSSTDLSGTYTVDIGNSYRYQFSNGAIIKYSDMGDLFDGDFSEFTVELKPSFLPGYFSVTDMYGGYYYAGRNYDARYLMSGIIAFVEADNSIILVDSFVPGWGDGLDGLDDGIYDPDTETIEWGALYADSYSFNVVLNKN